MRTSRNLWLAIRVRRVAAAAAVALVLAVLAAGCGGSQSSEEKWANSVCTYFSDWKTSVNQAVSDAKAKVKAPQAGMADAIKADLQSAATATETLTKNLKSLGPPSDNSNQVKQQLDTLTAQYQQLLNQAKQAAAGVPANAGLSEIANAFLPLATSLQSLGTSTKNTLSAIQADSKALKQGFDDAKSCKEFRS